MRVGDRTLARFQSRWLMMLAVGTFLVAGGAMTAGGRATAGKASGRIHSTSAYRALPAAAQSAMSAALGRDQQTYHAAAICTGYRMKNPRSGLQATFTREGVRVESGKASWGMELAAFGTSGKLQPVTAVTPQANKNRVEYRRGALTEWYVNGPAGLEQGFTIARVPVGSANGTLELALRLTGNLTASVDAAKTGLILKGRQTSLRYSGLEAKDAKGHKLRSWLEVRNGQLLVQVAAAGATYPLVVDPYIQVAKLVASDGAKYDNLGYAISMSADGSTMVAGVPNATVGSNGYQGAVYVFTKSGSGWTQAAKLVASDGTQYDGLGSSVAISEDGSTVVAAAPYATVNSNQYEGAVYVFVKPPSGWSDTTDFAAKLTVSVGNGRMNDYLANALSVGGDSSTVAAAALYSYGSVYVFVKQGDSWTNENESANLVPSDGSMNNPVLSYSVGVSEHGSTVAAGTDPYYDTPAGAVYVFYKPSGGWPGPGAPPQVSDAKLVASDRNQGDGLGTSLSLSADGSTVVAGAPFAPVTFHSLGIPTYGPGAAYIFTKSGSDWTQAAKLTAFEGVADDSLGTSVSISGDKSTVAVGAPGANSDEGAVYLFTNPWAAGLKLAAPKTTLTSPLPRMGLATSTWVAR